MREGRVDGEYTERSALSVHRCGEQTCGACLWVLVALAG